MAYSYLATPSATRAVLEAHGLSTKKSLGQHFLVNDGVVGRICELAQVSSGDHIVEVGPGIGTLTCALLAAGAQVVAVERDTQLLPVLDQTCAEWESQLCVINADAQKITADHLPFAPEKFVANLPYAVAATLVLDFFQQFESLQQATVMVQTEVANRMAARPGTKDYGAYSVKLALYATPEARFQVSPGNFFPPPRVDSTVIRLNRVAQTTLNKEQLKWAATMADAAFANRRKTLANSCKTFFAYKPQIVDALPSVFSSCGIDPACRGETLDLEAFKALGCEACQRLSSL